MSYTDSILTEEYVNKFNECLIPDQDSIYMEDARGAKILNQKDDYKYSNQDLSSFDITNIHNNQLEFDDKDAFNIERKYQEILKKRRNRTSNFLQSYQPPSSQYHDNFRHHDDHGQNTVFDDYSMEIKQKKNEIQMGLEKERRRNVNSEMRTNKLAGPSSPRETLERKVMELDHLSTSVKQATLEHRQLCKELQEMQSQLRKNQAEVRLTERMALDNKERIEIINKELKGAEQRRDQTVRHLDLVNEELALKKAKLRSFDTEIKREISDIRKMDQHGIDKEEIEKILAERDELYEIVKRQENIQFEKYELAKQLDLIRDDLVSEQEKAARQIENLEDELECSLKKIKQLQFEKDEFEAQFEHIRQHLYSAEDQASKSAREISELRDDYQNRIKKKLVEYERDKDRIEKDLKKIEEEKSMDASNFKIHIEKLKRELLITENEKNHLKELVAEQDEHLRKAAQSRDMLKEDYEFKIRQLQNDKEEALQKQKKELLNEQKLLIEEKDIQHGHLRNKIQKQCNEEIDIMVKNFQMKDKEIEELFERLKATENDHNNQIQKEKLKFENILQKERKNFQESNIKKNQYEINKIRTEYEVKNKSLTDHIDQLTATLGHRDIEISAVKRENSNIRLESQKLINENLIVARKIKETIKQDIVKDLKGRYEEKMDKELIKIKSECDKKLSSKISSILKEKFVIEESEKRSKQFLYKIVQTVVHEINGECGKMAAILKVHPRKVDYSKLSEDFTKSDNIITQAIANLEACGSEIRNILQELEGKVKSLTEKISSDERKMEAEIQHIKMELNSEKLKDISEIREKLLKEYLKEINRLAKSPDVGLENLLIEKEKEISRILANRQSWKERAAEKLADKFDQHNTRKINELRNLLLKKEKEIRQLKVGRVRSISPVRHEMRVRSSLSLDKKDQSLSDLPSSIIARLQENLENLHKENNDLRYRISEFESFGRKSRMDTEIRSQSKSR